MVRRKTQEEFIEQANKVHNNFYDYSKFIYVNNYTKGTIICPTHKEFAQTPANHMKGQGCPICGKLKSINNRKLGINKFIKEADKVHGNKYDYSKVEYVNARTKIIIICIDHGEFSQTPDSHLRGCGCPKCCSNFKLSKKEFIKRANKIHNNKYNYSLAKYKNTYTKIIIVCPEHGQFEQTPEHHLVGYGCSKCSGEKLSKLFRKPLEIFIDEAKLIHKSKYDYSEFVYVNDRTKGVIICPKHGEFSQAPTHHLRGRGCPKCSRTVSNKSQKWLDSLKIPEDWRENTIKINGKMYKPDGLDKENQIIYEFYGDFWHGNPEVFDKNKINVANNKTFEFLYEKTLNREKELKKAGYDIVSIWEKEFDESYV